jgi:hypothetical protein
MARSNSGGSAIMSDYVALIGTSFVALAIVVLLTMLLLGAPPLG